MTKIINPDETLNIYYRTDSENITDIINVSKQEDDDFDETDLDNIQNVQMIQWSPNKKNHLDDTLEFNINGLKQKIHVRNIPKNGISRWAGLNVKVII